MCKKDECKSSKGKGRKREWRRRGGEGGEAYRARLSALDERKYLNERAAGGGEEEEEKREKRKNGERMGKTKWKGTHGRWSVKGELSRSELKRRKSARWCASRCVSVSSH